MAEPPSSSPFIAARSRMNPLPALATVCNVVPLIGLNRALVAKDLLVMQQRQNLVLQMLADTAGISSAPTMYHLGNVFKISSQMPFIDRTY